MKENELVTWNIFVKRIGLVQFSGYLKIALQFIVSIQNTIISSILQA